MAIRTPRTAHPDGQEHQEHAAVLRMFDQRVGASYVPDEPASDTAPTVSVAASCRPS